MVYCDGQLIENLKLFYKSNRTHFLWVNRRDNPLEMLGEHSNTQHPTRVGYHTGKPIESVIYCLSIYLGNVKLTGEDAGRLIFLFCQFNNHTTVQ